MPDRTTYELCLDGGSEVDIHDRIMDAFDAASDQNRTTWLTDAAGKRIAKIAPVDEIPDDIFDQDEPPVRIILVQDGTAGVTGEEDEWLSRVMGRLLADGAAFRRDEQASRDDRLLFPGQVDLQQRLTEDGADWRRRDLAGFLSAKRRTLEDMNDSAAASLDDLGQRLFAKRRETEPAWDRGRLDAIEARLNTIGQRIGSSPRDGEPGIIAQLARMEALQQVAARQVEEIHRTLGLERDEDGELISDTPMLAEVMAGQVETMYHGLGMCGDDGGFEDEDDFDPDMDEEIAGRLATGDLLVVNRDMLLQVLTDAGLVDGVTENARYEVVWEILRDVAHGKPAQPGEYRHTPDEPGPSRTLRDEIRRRAAARSERPEDLIPVRQIWPADVPASAPGRLSPGGSLTLEIVSDALSLAGVSVRMEALATWSYGQRLDAYDWAMREHLEASGNHVGLVQEPEHVTSARGRTTR